MVDGTAWLPWLTTSDLSLASTADGNWVLFLSLQPVCHTVDILIVHYGPTVIASAHNTLSNNTRSNFKLP